ncbi:MAG: YbhB/YbcL family Raf kinase inhibitor-like protein [Isosphaeraceae bacterium]|nr:YbhB/YbcL family Raf kinase inhibitor-like protein [Isosphaeraceae bacterium]
MNWRRILHGLALGALGWMIGCAESHEPAPALQAGERPMSITVKSTAFDEGQAIPKRYTGDGEDLSPPLSWSQLPAGTKSLALVVDDPDAPRADPWVHWLIYRIPAEATGLKEGVPQKEQLAEPAGALQGKNSWGTAGYRGPAPPKGHGTHHYHFKLYALNLALDLKPGLEKHDLLNAISGHVLGHGELVGTYQR